MATTTPFASFPGLGDPTNPMGLPPDILGQRPTPTTPSTATTPTPTANAPVTSTEQQQPSISIDIEKQQPLDTSITPQYFVDMQKRLTESDKGTSTLSQVLAWVSAAKGQFQPLLQIEEQKRQTALGRLMIPEMMKVSDMVREGKWEDAEKYVNALTGSFGPRAKETIPYLQQMAKNINDKKQAWDNLSFVYKRYKDTMGEDNPLVKTLADAVSKRDNVSETILGNYLTRTAPHQQVVGNSVVFSNPAVPGRVQQVPLQSFVDKDEANDFITQGLSSTYGINQTDLRNVLNNVAVRKADGSVIQPGSPEAQKIKQAYIDVAPLRMELGIAKDIPISPEFAAALKERGVSNLDIARRHLPGDVVRQAQDSMAGRAGIQKGLENVSQMMVNPNAPREAGYVAINIDPASGDYLKETPGMSYEDTRSSKKHQFIRQDVFDKKVVPANDVMRGLSYVDQLAYESDNNPRTGMDRVRAGMGRLFSEWTDKYAPGLIRMEGQTSVEAATVIVNKALDNLVDLGAIKSEDAASLRKGITGGFKSFEEAKAAVEKLKGYVAGNRDAYIGSKNEGEKSLADRWAQMKEAVRDVAQPSGSSTQQGSSKQTAFSLPDDTNKKLEASMDAHKINNKNLLKAIVFEESGGRHKDEKGNVKTSPAGARGTMQVMPDTGRRNGVTNLDDENENIKAGVREFKNLENATQGNVKEILAGYVGGEGGIRAYRTNNKGNIMKPEAYAYLQSYVDRVYKRYERVMSGTPEVKELSKGVPAPASQKSSGSATATAQKTPVQQQPAPIEPPEPQKALTPDEIGARAAALKKQKAG